MMFIFPMPINFVFVCIELTVVKYLSYCCLATGSENKHISKDTWKMTADFAKANTGPTPAALARKYDESAIENCSWPVLLDDFVEHCQKAAASS